MKNTFISIVLAASSISLSANAFTEEVTGPFISAGANHFIFDNERLLNDETSAFIDLGYQLSNQWAISAEYTELNTERSWTGGNKFETEFWSVNGLFRFEPKTTNSLFYKMGVGQYTETPVTTHKSTARLGIGYDFSFSNHISLKFGADALIGINKSRLDWVPYIGLSYFFGKSTTKMAPVAAQPAKQVNNDRDQDGIFDSQDKCPETAPGISVDSYGCELDSDNDTVFDSVDQCPQTPAGAKVNDKGCRVLLKEDVSITLNIQFPNNSNVVSQQYATEIRQVAQFMKQYPDTKVVIEGHTDSRGSADYNLKLSQKRANAVMRFLIQEYAISVDRISAVGMGESAPIETNDTAEGRKLNRRVQAEIKATISK